MDGNQSWGSEEGSWGALPGHVQREATPVQLLPESSPEYLGEHPHLPLPPLPRRALLTKMGRSCRLLLGVWQDSLRHGLLHWKTRKQTLWICDYQVGGRVASSRDGCRPSGKYALMVVTNNILFCSLDLKRAHSF